MTLPITVCSSTLLDEGGTTVTNAICFSLLDLRISDFKLCSSNFHHDVVHYALVTKILRGRSFTWIQPAGYI